MTKQVPFETTAVVEANRHRKNGVRTMRYIAAIALLAASACSAQQIPFAEIQRNATNVPAFTSSITKGAPSRTLDARYYLLNGLHLEMTLLDIQMTRRCINAGTCKEGNPLMPSSFGGQLGVGFALVGAGAAESYWLKRHHSHMWWIAPVVGIAAHGVGLASGIAWR